MGEQGFGNFGELVILGDALEEIALLVVVGREDDKVDDVAKDGGPLCLVLLDTRCVVDLSVVLADLEVLGRVEAPEDHEAVETEFEVLDRLLAVSFLSTLPSGRKTGAKRAHLVLLLREPLAVDPLRDDGQLVPVGLDLEQTHLLEDKVDLLAPFHRAKGLDLQLLEEVGRGGDVARGLLDRRQHPRHTRSWYLEVDLFTGKAVPHAMSAPVPPFWRAAVWRPETERSRETHLALRDLPERLDQVQLCLPLELGEVGHGLVDHLLRGLPELAVLAGEDANVVVEELPLLLLVQNRDGRDEDAGGGSEVGSLHEEQARL